MAGASSRVKAGEKWTCILALAMVVAGCGGSTASSTQAAPSGRSAPTSEPASPASSNSTTTSYLAALNLDLLLAHSASYEASRFSGDPTAYIDQLRGTLRGVDRVAVLRAVFERLTAGLQPET